MAAPMKPSIFGLSRSFLNRFGAVSGLSVQGIPSHRSRAIIFQRYINSSSQRSLKNSRNVVHCRASVGTLRTQHALQGQAQTMQSRQCQWQCQWNLSHTRWMTTGVTEEALRKEIDRLTESFMEAKELLDDARESMGTVYFNEDLEDADQAVDETLKGYQALLSRLNEAQRQNVKRTIGLKMGELSAHKEMIRDLLKD